MRSSVVIAACAALANGAPAGSWTWDEHSHPGWSKATVYTPESPEHTWPWTNGPHPTSEWETWSQSAYISPQSTPSSEKKQVMSTYTSVPSTATASYKPAPTSVYTPKSTATTPYSGYHPMSTTISMKPSKTSVAPQSYNACMSVSSLAKQMTDANPSATPTVPAALAYECINSVPFNQSAAVALLDSMRPYLEWQTTIQYIEDPPAEYAQKVQAPYDFTGEFQRVYNMAMAGSYENEYSFGLDLYFTFQKCHDGHFVIYPDSVTEIFSFGRTTPLVSVSADGESIPEVYVYADVLQASFDSTFKPSPLSMINGQDSTEWLLNFSMYGSLQDKDALWNNMFYLLAQVSLGPSGTGAGTFAGGGRGRWIYGGPTTTLTFANGTSITNENFANVLVPLDGITGGESIYQTFFVPPPGQPEPVEEIATMMSSSSSSSAVPSSSSSTTIPAPGYPTPIIRDPDNLNSGYFLEGAGYDDVAVLSIPSFVGAGSEIDFQIVNTYLINQAVAHGKKKLIIDLSANGGGTILQGYDVFKQLFPAILPYGATRFKAHEAFNLIGEEISAFSGMVPRSLNTNQTTQDYVSSAFNYRTDVDVNYENFQSWPDKYGPQVHGPQAEEYSNLIRWNLSDVLTPDNSGGIYVSGYLKRANITMQPFAAENIVVVTDGYCASTCTIFSEFMRQQAGVKYIALGGRPNKDIIQAVGGVKGTNDFPYSYIFYAAEAPFKLQELHDDAYYNSTALGAYSDLPLFRTTASVVNARDGIRQGDESQTPLQFVYEPADCRIYYTPEMAVDQTAAWKTVADTAFNGINHCVAGGLSGGSGAAASVPRSKHSVAQGMDLSNHYRAMKDVGTGKGGVAVEGDGFMPL